MTTIYLLCRVLAFNSFPLLNKTARFTKPVSKDITFIEYCLKYGVKQVEILNFYIFNK